MFRALMIATAGLTLMSGVGLAQSSASSSTTITTTGVAPAHNVDITTTTRRTADRNGVMIEKDTTGTEVSTPGSPSISQTRTNTTTVR